MRICELNMDSIFNVLSSKNLHRQNNHCYTDGADFACPFYIWEKKVKNKVRLFRLPLLLSMIFVIYSILESFNLNSLIFLTALWLFFLIVYLLKNNKLAKKNS